MPTASSSRISNGVATSSPATVSITVVGKPTVNAQSVTTTQNGAVAITLTGSDPNSPALPLSFSVTVSPSHGSLTGTAPNLTYTPDSGYVGSDSFQFTGSNGVATSDPATVSFSVSLTTSSLNAKDIYYTIKENTALNGQRAWCACLRDATSRRLERDFYRRAIAWRLIVDVERLVHVYTWSGLHRNGFVSIPGADQHDAEQCRDCSYHDHGEHAEIASRHSVLQLPSQTVDASIPLGLTSIIPQIGALIGMEMTGIRQRRPNSFP